MKKLLCLTAIILFSSGLWILLPRQGNNVPAVPPVSIIEELHTADATQTRAVVIATNYAPANEQIHLYYGEAEPYIGVTSGTGIPVPASSQMILQIFTPAENSFYNFEKIIVTENETETEITTSPYQIPVAETNLNIFVQFVPIEFGVTLEICDNEGNIFSGEQYTRIRENYINAPKTVTVGDLLKITVDTEALYAGEAYTLAGIQIRTFDASGNITTPYPTYIDGMTVNGEFIERYSKNMHNIRLRFNLIKKYKFSLVIPTDPNAEWHLTVKVNGNDPVKDPSQSDNYSYLADSGSKITITTQVINKYTANDGFAGLPDVEILTTDTALIKSTEFFIKQNSAIKLLIAPKVFTLTGVTDNPDYKLTKDTISLGDKVGIVLQDIPQNYGISSWTINGRSYEIEGNTVYITADKLWFQVNDKFIDLDAGVIQLDSNPTLKFKSDILMVFGLPAGIAFICLLIMFVFVAINKMHTETIKEHLLGTGKTYRLKVKEENRRIMLEKHQKEVEEFQRVKQERLDKIKAQKAEELAKKQEEEENQKRQQQLTAEQKQAVYEQEAAEYKMPAKAASTDKTPEPEKKEETKYNMPPSAAITESEAETASKFNMPPAPTSVESETAASSAEPGAQPIYNMPPKPASAEQETAPAAGTAVQPTPGNAAATLSATEQAVTTSTVTETAAVPTAETSTPAPVAPVSETLTQPTPTPVSIPTPVITTPASAVPTPAPVRMPQPPAPRTTMPRPMGQPLPPRPGMPMPPRPMPPQMAVPPRTMQPPIPMGQRPQPQPLTGQPRPMGQPLPRPVTPMQQQTASLPVPQRPAAPPVSATA